MWKSFWFYCGFCVCPKLAVAPQGCDPYQVDRNRRELRLEAYAALAPAPSPVHPVEAFHFAVLPLLCSTLFVFLLKLRRLLLLTLFVEQRSRSSHSQFTGGFLPALGADTFVPVRTKLKSTARSITLSRWSSGILLYNML